MRLLNYTTKDGQTGSGRLFDAAVVPLPYAELKALLLDPDGLKRAKEADSSAPSLPLSELELRPPIENPGKIFCIGVNYVAHRSEMEHETFGYPTIFTRFANTLVAHGQPLVVPSASSHLDYEGELAVVIGRPGRHIAKAEALAHVAGYSCFNDGSVRDFQRHTTQYTPGKNFDQTGGFGPYLVTPEAIEDPQNLKIQTVVNEDCLQDSNTSLMIHPIADLIVYISSFASLAVGDVIVTGTPGGVGVKRKPPRFLKPGDQVKVAIEGVGELIQPVVAEGR